MAIYVYQPSVFNPYFCFMNKYSWLPLVFLLAIIISCNDNNGNNDGNDTPAKPIPALSFSVVATHPHDTSYFTEGLEFYKGTLLESTGNYEKSLLVQKEFPGGKILKQVKLADSFFGEGVTVFADTVYQLTYREHKVLVYDIKDLRKIKELPLNGEGWGLTHNDKELIASNGSSDIYFYEPGTFKLLRTLGVTENGAPVVNINELEWVNGFIYANQWQYNYILKINPANGEVVAKMDLTELVKSNQAKQPAAQELNGIAYNPLTKKFYVTGKNWPEIFELQFAF